MRYWASLQNDGDMVLLERGAEMLQKEALVQHVNGAGEPSEASDHLLWIKARVAEYSEAQEEYEEATMEED